MYSFSPSPRSFFFALFMTRSFTLTFGGVFGILMAFPWSYFLYRFLFGFKWVGILHFIGIFVILGIGCDDIFVVFEHWNQAKSEITAGRRDYSLVYTLDCAGRLFYVQHIFMLPGMVSNPSDPQALAVARMSWTLRHGVKAMGATSFTTMVAFLSNAICQIVPIRLFGVFMGLLVFSNFLLVITWFPALIIAKV